MIFMTSVIDAKEKRDVCTLNLLGILHATQDKIVHTVLHGKLVELLVLTAPEIYSKFIQIGKYGKLILHVNLRSALLFYMKLVVELNSMGFKINSYYICITSRNVE